VVDAGQRLLDRVLGGDDVDVRLVDVVEHRVQGGRLARSGGTRDEDQALLEPSRAADHLELVPAEAEAVQVGQVSLLLEQADHRLLAEHRGQGRDPEAQGLVPVLHGHLAVLGLAALGDVHAGEDLDPADDRTLDPLGRRHHREEAAVHAKAHPGEGLVGLDVDVAGPLLDRPLQDVVHQPDGAGPFFGTLKVGLGIEAAVVPGSTLVGLGRVQLRILDDLVHEQVGHVARRHEAPEAAFGDQSYVDDRHAEHEAQVVDGVVVAGIRHAEHHGLPLQGERDGLVALDELLGDQPPQLLGGIQALHVGDVQAELVRELPVQGRLGQEAQVDQGAAQASPVGLLVLEGPLELPVLDEALVHELLAQALAGPGWAREARSQGDGHGHVASFFGPGTPLSVGPGQSQLDAFSWPVFPVRAGSPGGSRPLLRLGPGVWEYTAPPLREDPRDRPAPARL